MGQKIPINQNIRMVVASFLGVFLFTTIGLLASCITGCKKSNDNKIEDPNVVLFRALHISLPETAQNIHAMEEGLMAWHTYARFDVPEKEWDLILDNAHYLPPKANFGQNTTAQKRLQELNPIIEKMAPWWVVVHQEDSLYGQAKGTMKLRKNEREWRWETYLSVTPLKNGLARVFVYHFEEP